MLKNYQEFLRHILDECDYLLSVIDEEKAFEDFINDDTLKRAVVRSLEIIGEASKQIPEDICQKHNNIPWRNMAGLRDKLIHHYFGINYHIVWDVIKNKIPTIKEDVLTIIDNQ